MVEFVGVCLVRKHPDIPGPEEVNKFVSAAFIFLLALAFIVNVDLKKIKVASDDQRPAEIT